MGIKNKNQEYLFCYNFSLYQILKKRCKKTGHQSFLPIKDIVDANKHIKKAHFVEKFHVLTFKCNIFH